MFFFSFLKLRQTGILKRIMDKTWQQNTKEILIEPAPVVTLAMVATVHILFLFGVLLSVVILCMENIIWRGRWYKQKREWRQICNMHCYKTEKHQPNNRQRLCTKDVLKTY